MIYRLILCPSLRPDSLSTHPYLNHHFPCRLWLRPPTGVPRSPPIPCSVSQGSHLPPRATRRCGKQLGANPALSIAVRSGLSLKPLHGPARAGLCSPLLLPVFVFCSPHLPHPRPLQMCFPQPLQRCKNVSLHRHGDASPSSCPPCGPAVTPGI